MSVETQNGEATDIDKHGIELERQCVYSQGETRQRGKEKSRTMKEGVMRKKTLLYRMSMKQRRMTNVKNVRGE